MNTHYQTYSASTLKSLNDQINVVINSCAGRSTVEFVGGVVVAPHRYDFNGEGQMFYQTVVTRG